MILMEVDPMEIVQLASEQAEKDRAAARLNTLVAITVAILATFMGICKVKDDNIVQSMQQAQANKIDHWAYYQARKIREEVANAAVLQMQLNMADAAIAQQQRYEAAISRYLMMVREQSENKAELLQQAEQDQKDYDAANFRDDRGGRAGAGRAGAGARRAGAARTRKP